VPTDTITLFLLDLAEVVVEGITTSAVQGVLIGNCTDAARSTVDYAVDRVARVEVVPGLSLGAAYPLVRRLYPAAVDEVVRLVGIAPQTVSPPRSLCRGAVTAVARTNWRRVPGVWSANDLANNDEYM
jgi:hypothetical protein